MPKKQIIFTIDEIERILRSTGISDDYSMKIEEDSGCEIEIIFTKGA